MNIFKFSEQGKRALLSMFLGRMHIFFQKYTFKASPDAIAFFYGARRKIPHGRVHAPANVTAQFDTASPQLLARGAPYGGQKRAAALIVAHQMYVARAKYRTRYRGIADILDDPEQTVFDRIEPQIEPQDSVQKK